MLGLYLTFGFLAMGGVALALYWLVRIRRMHKTNLLVSEELDRIISSTLKTIQKSKKEMTTGALDDGLPDMLDSPDLMSTLITVLINKFGDVRLGMQDFMIDDENYVSIYVDTNTQEIILSTKHDISMGEVYYGYKNPNDNTFH